MSEEQLNLLEISAQLFAIKYEMFKDSADRKEFNKRIDEYSLKCEMNKHPDDRKLISERMYNLKFSDLELK